MKPQQQPNLSALTWGKFWYVKGVFCPAATLLQPGNPGSSPPTPPHNIQPLQQLVSGAEMWLLPKHMTVYCYCCQLTLENNPNGNSENLWPNRLISTKKLFPRKERARGNVQWCTVKKNCTWKFRPWVYCQDWGGLHRVVPVQGAVSTLRRKGKSGIAETTHHGLAALLCSTHWWQSQSWDCTASSPVFTWKR